MIELLLLLILIVMFFGLVFKHPLPTLFIAFFIYAAIGAAGGGG